jgi:phosphatidate cytidylyltransferase
VTRVLSGAVLLVIAVAAVWFSPGWLFFLIAEGLLLVAFVEYANLSAAAGLPIPRAVAGAATVLTCAGMTSTHRLGNNLVGAASALDAILMSAFLVMAVITLTTWRGGKDALGSVAAAILPALYLGLPIGAMHVIRELHGPQGLFLLMLTVFVSDTAQYYSGRTFGRRPLAPAISPKKTIEGAIGGVAAGALVMAVVGQWWLPAVPAALRALLGVALVALGIAGDLFESMLKRSAGVKDSSALIPGHGGVLDRIDALLFAAPVYYVVMKYV